MMTEEMLPTRRFAAGETTFVVLCPSASVRDAVEVLFGDLEPGKLDGSTSSLTLRQNESGKLSLAVDDQDAGPALSPNWALAGLLTAVNRLGLDAGTGKLHLHAAGLSLNGRGLLISAASGTGKTTLAGYLCQSGWTYVSDEMIALQLGSTTAMGFAKPLILKTANNHVLPNVEANKVALDGPCDMSLVPVGAFGTATSADVEINLVVILQPTLVADFTVDSVVGPLHPADCVVSLMNQTMDAERYGVNALLVLAGLAARSQCVQMTTGALESGRALLEDLVASPFEPLAVTELFAPSGNDSAWQICDSVKSVLIQDRVVVHDVASGSIAALDQSGTAVWQSLCGVPPSWWQLELMSSASTVSFLDALASHGFVRQPAPPEEGATT